MKYWIAAAATALIMFNAHAAPASVESIERLLVVTKSEAMMESLYPSMESMMRQGIAQGTAGKSLKPDQQRVLDNMIKNMMEVIKTEFNWAIMRVQYVEMYRSTFEQDEIDGLVSFYQSPIGQAFIAKMPVIAQKSMGIAQQQIQTLIPRMQRAVEQALKDAKVAS